MKPIHYLILNILLAVLWMILNGQADISHFLLGFGIGFLILWIFQYLLNASNYVRMARGFVRFLFSFSLMFLKSNLNMAKIILFYYKNTINPSFFSYPIHDLTHFEALLLSQLITLTPGSVSVNLEKSILRVHLIDLKESDHACKNIDEIKSLILGFTR